MRRQWIGMALMCMAALTADSDWLIIPMVLLATGAVLTLGGQKE